jgi:hypothetical protein
MAHHSYDTFAAALRGLVGLVGHMRIGSGHL